MDELFKHIRREKGKYVIDKRDKDFWGEYDRIEDALHTRDLLIDCDWDIGELIARDEKENKYTDMDIPSFDDYLAWKDRMKYITKQKSGGRTYYVIQKKINGVVKRFGYFKTLDEAIERKRLLIEKGWL